MSELYNVDWRDWLPYRRDMPKFDHIITDITYGEQFNPDVLLGWINGNLITFEKPNRLFLPQPTHIYYWIKPSLPKNTVNQLADPVEWIYVWRKGWDAKKKRGGCYNGPKVSEMQNGNYNTVRYDLVEGAQLIPEQKPLSLLLWLLELHTRPGESVLDICAGSGTTLLACDMLGRKGYGCESNPATYEIARKRLGL